MKKGMTVMKTTTTLRMWGVASLLIAFLWLTARPAAGQLSGTLDSTTSTLDSTVSSTTSTVDSTTSSTTSTVDSTTSTTTSTLTSTTSSLLSIGLSSITATPLDWETVVGSLTLTNITSQAVTVDGVLMAIEFVGSSGTSSTCDVVSVFTNLVPGTIISAAKSLKVDFNAVCAEGTPPLDTHEIVSILAVTLVGSEVVHTSSAVSHL